MESTFQMSLSFADDRFGIDYNPNISIENLFEQIDIFHLNLGIFGKKLYWNILLVCILEINSSLHRIFILLFL